jgi:glycosyltransferase involved in cell wall biosynthesis
MTSDSNNVIDVSVIIPVLNEQNTICILCDRLIEVLARLNYSFEIIVVDDGSTDDTALNAKQNAVSHPEIKVLKCRRNFGKATALNIGFKSSSGRIVITMDGDLQDDPNEIPSMIDKINDGWDMISGWKKNRKDSIGKRLPSLMFNYFTSRMSGVKIHDFNCGFKAYRRKLVDCLNLYGDMHRFIPALANWMGFKITEIPVNHLPRTEGHSKYGIERFSRGWFDFLTIAFITHFNGRPMHFFGKLGTLFLALGGMGSIYMSYLWFQREYFGANIGAIGTRPFLHVSMLLIIVGLLFYATGLIAELLFHITRSTKLEPHLLLESDTDEQ